LRSHSNTQPQGHFNFKAGAAALQCSMPAIAAVINNQGAWVLLELDVKYL
jgi:hypothetical protein